jgi:hypothetical protein
MAIWLLRRFDEDVFLRQVTVRDWNETPIVFLDFQASLQL